MKVLKKLLMLAVCGILAIGVAACTSPSTPTTFKVEVADFSMEVGLSKTLAPKLTPAGTQATYSYTAKTVTPENCVTISNGTVQAHEAGTATFEVTATSLANASEAFSVKDTFTVTVTNPETLEGDSIINGGFENGFFGWTLTPANPLNEFKNETTNNEPHGGVSALNLWSKVGGTEGSSDVLDLVISQEIDVESTGDYLFSLWFKGSIQTMTLTVLDGTDEVASESFNVADFAVYAMSNHQDYINFGTDVTIDTVGAYTVELHFEAPSNNWGFVDDISFVKGSTEDLIRPVSPEMGEYNFVQDGNISADYRMYWNNVGTSDISRYTDNKNYINCYGTDFHFYQTITDLPALTYSAVAQVIGGSEGYPDLTDAYFYIADADGDIIVQNDITMPGYSWTRIEIDNQELSGTVRIGIVFASTSNAWAGFTGFVLYSEGYERTLSLNTGFSNIKVDGIAVTDTDGDLSVELPFLRYNTFVQAKADVKSFVSGTLAYQAKLTSAAFNDTTGVLSIVVTAENGTTKTYEIEVTQEVVADTRPQVNLGLERDSWTYDATEDDLTRLWFTDGKLSYCTDTEQGPARAMTFTQDLTDIAEGEYKLVVVYSIKHANITVNNVSTTYGADDWDYLANQTLEVTGVTITDSGAFTVELILTPMTWCSITINSITLVPVSL